MAITEIMEYTSLTKSLPYRIYFQFSRCIGCCSSDRFEKEINSPGQAAGFFRPSPLPPMILTTCLPDT